MTFVGVVRCRWPSGPQGWGQDQVPVHMMGLPGITKSFYAWLGTDKQPAPWRTIKLSQSGSILRIKTT